MTAMSYDLEFVGVADTSEFARVWSEQGFEIDGPGGELVLDGLAAEISWEFDDDIGLTLDLTGADEEVERASMAELARRVLSVTDRLGIVIHDPQEDTDWRTVDDFMAATFGD
jgi:hypothetical protein